MVVVLDVKDLDVRVIVATACAQCLLVVLLLDVCPRGTLLVLLLLLLVQVELFHLLSKSLFSRVFFVVLHFSPLFFCVLEVSV